MIPPSCIYYTSQPKYVFFCRRMQAYTCCLAKRKGAIPPANEFAGGIALYINELFITSAILYLCTDCYQIWRNLIFISLQHFRKRRNDQSRFCIGALHNHKYFRLIRCPFLGFSFFLHAFILQKTSKMTSEKMHQPLNFGHENDSSPSGWRLC